MNQRKELDIAVVGAGMIGLSAAYFLQKLGAKVTLIDKSSVGDCIPKLGFTQVMAYCQKIQPGSPTERGVALAQMIAKDLGYIGTLHDVDHEACVPHNEVLGQNRVVTLSDFAIDLAARCRDSGVRILEKVPVNRLLGFNNEMWGVETASGSVIVDEVVICAGLHSQVLLSSAGLSLPLKAAENGLGASWARQGIPGVFTGMVPLTPSGAPYVGRPEGYRGLYLGIGHGTNPAAAISVGDEIAQALCGIESRSVNVLLRRDHFAGHPVVHAR